MDSFDPYQWRESVLSTRSLSYVSNLGEALESLRPSRKNTLTSMSSKGEQEVEEEEDEEEDQDYHDALSDVPPPMPTSIASSPLFRLPNDIRCQIWSYLLRSPSDIVWPTAQQSLALNSQVLLVCKAVYEEAAYMLYTTNTLCFSHPSDANMFAHALSSRLFSQAISHVTLRIRAQDTRLWTGWFNTNAPERSLSQDLPSLKTLTIRYRGPRWQPALNEKANADLWLKDPKLQEIILSVRKCVMTVRILLCVRLPTEVREQLGRVEENGEERLPHVMFRKWAWLNGCYIRVEPIGKDEE